MIKNDLLTGILREECDESFSSFFIILYVTIQKYFNKYFASVYVWNSDVVNGSQNGCQAK